MKQLFIVLLMVCAIAVFAQYSPGELPFTYINIAVSPISSALSMSGAAADSPHRDIYNPASACFNTSSNDIYFSYMAHFASSHFGYIEYNMPSMRIGLKYFNSGSMEKRDSLNNYLGDFSDNTLLFNYAYGYAVNEQISIGASILAGMENIDNFSQYAGALSAGIIYRFNEILTLGFYAGNAGVSYSDGIDILPARIIAGAKIGSSKTPVNLYIDAGKILDSDYFYSLGAELYVLRRTENILNEESVQLYEDASEGMETEDAMQETDMAEDIVKAELNTETALTDSMAAIDDMPEEEKADSIFEESKSDTLSSEEDTFMSYADYLEQLEKDSEDNTEETEETIDEESASEVLQTADKVEITKRPSFMNQFGFVLRGGLSSDKQMLQSGTSLDLIAGLSAGFGLSFRNYQIDYAAKFWGELGIGHSVGVKVVF